MRNNVGTTFRISPSIVAFLAVFRPYHNEGGVRQAYISARFTPIDSSNIAAPSHRVEFISFREQSVVNLFEQFKSSLFDQVTDII